MYSGEEREKTLEIYAKIAYANGNMAADFRKCSLDEATQYLNALKRRVTNWPHWTIIDYRNAY